MAQSSVQDTMVKERKHLYYLLSRVYRAELTQDFLQHLRRNLSLLLVLKELGFRLDENFDNDPLEKVIEEYAVEYTRLFLGPGKHIYPYESAYSRSSKLSDTATRMKNLIESCSLKYRPDFHESFDHISIELEFMAKIVEAEAYAEKGKDIGKKIELLKFERRFLDEHLLKWVPEFADRVIKETHFGFYRGMAELTKKFILSESREIESFILQK